MFSVLNKLVDMVSNTTRDRTSTLVLEVLETEVRRKQHVFISIIILH